MQQKQTNYVLAALTSALLFAPIAVSAGPPEGFGPESIQSFVNREQGDQKTNQADRTLFGTVSLLGALIHDKAISDISGLNELVAPEILGKVFPATAPSIETQSWQEFFQGAVILIGNGLSEEPVLGYYNVLVDHALIIYLKREGDKLQASDMFVLSGQALRGRAKIVLPKTISIPSPFLAAYKASADAFTKLYPPTGRHPKPILFDHNRTADKQTLLDHIGQVRQQTERVSKDKSFLSLVESFKTATDEGNVSALKALFPAATITPPEWLANVPAPVRRSLQLMAVFQHGDDLHVVLMAPTATRLMVLLTVKSGAQPSLSELILSDFAQIGRSY